MITANEWQAIKENDIAYDDLFRYAVKTTKIFCRPSCHSRLPKKENIEIYYDLEEPEKQGYRPCKRGRPTDKVVDNEEWAQEIATILAENYHLNLSLEELAYLAHGSASHLWHVFKKVTNQTPQQKLMNIRMATAKNELLTTTNTVEKIASHVGLPNVSYFIRKFRERYGYSPKQFRKKQQEN